MKQYTIKSGNSSEEMIVRKVKLIPIDDKKYLKNQKNWKRWRTKRKKTTDGEVDTSFRNFMKFTLLVENVIRHWVKSSNNRVLCWEEFDGCIWERHYTEIDFVTELDDNNIIVGEIKTQLNNKKPNNNMSKQFENRRNLLQCIPDLKFQFLGILVLVEKSDGYVTKNGNFTSIELQEFKDNFFETEKISNTTSKDFEIFKMKLLSEELMNYGIKENIINEQHSIEDFVVDNFKNR